MINPFISYTSDNKPYLTDICSINKLSIAKLPFDGVIEDIQGLKANQIISTKVIADVIRKNAKSLRIDADLYSNSQLAKKLEEALDSEDDNVRTEAERIFKVFGYRLGAILLTLKQGKEENRRLRPGWGKEHWEYWNKLKRIILVGGLTNGKSGERLKKYALEAFSIANTEPYDILLFPNASHYGTLGCATRIVNKDKSAVVFDFGQTNIKRCIVDFDGDKILTDQFLESIPSLYMEWMDIVEDEGLKLAYKLHNRLVNVISDTYREASREKELSNEIIISIASYTVSGRLHALRGGYAKLTMLSDNYGEYLQEALRKELGKDILVTLIHDGSAIAMYFNDYKDSVCVSLGTAFGVGFPM